MNDSENQNINSTPDKDPNEVKSNESELQIGKPKRQHAVNTLLLAIAVILGALLVGFLAANVSAVSNAVGIINRVISPVVIGFVIAYLCNPILRFYEFAIFIKLQKKHPKLCRGLSIACTIITVLAFITLVLVLIIPELVETIKSFFSDISSYITKFADTICNLLNKFNGININNEAVKQEISDFFIKFNESSDVAIEELVTKYLGYESTADFLSSMSGGNTVGKITDLIGSVYNAASALLVIIKDIFLGTFIGFYVLGAKERLYAMIMKCRKAWFSDKANGKITRVCSLIDTTFGGYIKGTLTDSLLVACETWLFFTIFGISKYNLLLAVFIGITNIIPVFGPFIGAIPTGFIVLITNADNPIKFWIFVILVIVIQQIDGNIILPKILGSQTGVSSLCVLIAVTVMGNWLGVLGMVIAVPVFATAIFLIRDNVDELLKKKGLSTELADYYASNTIVSGEEDLSHKYNFFIRFVFKVGGFFKKIGRGISGIFLKKDKPAKVKKEKHKKQK